MAAVEVARYAAAVPVMYAVMSFNEYVTHRYFQHAEFNKTPWMQQAWCKVFGVKEAPRAKGGGHVEHHAETLDDMSLKADPKWRASAPAAVLVDDPYRGTAFNYNTTSLMWVQMVPLSLPLLMIMGFSLPASLGVMTASLLIHGLVWNCLHPAMHGLPDVPMQWGLPSSWLNFMRDSSYFNWIYQNHVGHHVLGGTVNYNVCCPGMDHILGTYVPVEEWEPKAVLPAREDGVRPYYVAGEYARACEAADAAAIVSA